MPEPREDRRDPARLEQIITAAISKAVPVAVEQTFVRFGIDTRDPIAVQEQFHTLREVMAYEKHPDTKPRREWVDRTWRRCKRVEEAITSGAVKLALGAIGVIGLAGIVAVLKEKLGL